MATCNHRSAMFAIAVVVGLLALMVGETKAQTPSCAANLVPCVDFLNSTSPPESCCKPLRETVATQRDCLCSLYKNPTLIQQLRINVTQALELPRHCGVPVDTSLCSTNPAPAPTPTTTPITPPAVPRNDGNREGKMAWTGASGFLLFWVSIMAY